MSDIFRGKKPYFLSYQAIAYINKLHKIRLFKFRLSQKDSLIKIQGSMAALTRRKDLRLVTCALFPNSRLSLQ